jgi:hypothetical protein
VKCEVLALSLLHANKETRKGFHSNIKIQLIQYGVRINGKAMPDLPLCFGVLKHRASLARGGLIFLPKNILRWIFAYVVQF